MILTILGQLAVTHDLFKHPATTYLLPFAFVDQNKSKFMT